MKACRFVFSRSASSVQRREDVASAGSRGFHRHDGGDRNVVKGSRTIAGDNMEVQSATRAREKKTCCFPKGRVPFFLLEPQ